MLKATYTLDQLPDGYAVVEEAGDVRRKVARGLGRRAAMCELRRYQRGFYKLTPHPDETGAKWRQKGWNGMFR